MRGPTHAVIGLGVATPFAAVAMPHSVIAAGALLAAGVMAGTAPDVDLRLGLRHRGVTHSVWAAAAVALLVLVAGEAFEARYPDPALATAVPLLALVAGLAWVSHILADLTNRSRVAVFWPWWWGRFRWGVREGSVPSLAEEWAVRLLVIALIAVESARYLGSRLIG
jgi:membrane-bound metal-dependent hydrolase YbcI (DUF457 family)